MTTPIITIRTRLAGALAAVLVVAAIAIGSGQPAAAAANPIRQGGSWLIAGLEDTAQITVSPPQGGTVSSITGGAATFTASATFLGPVTVCWTLPAQCVEFDVVGNTAAASGSFVPVAAPGPCILITVNPVVSFGDVEIGGPFKSTPAPPNVAGCAPNSVLQDVSVKTSNATSGLSTLTPTCVGQTPAGCTTVAGSYAVAILDDGLVVGPTDTVWLAGYTGNFSVRAPQLAVKMPPTLAPTFLGSLFTFDVTFTAMTAIPA